LLPERFLNYVFRDRVRLIEKMASGSASPDLLIQFTRHTPAVITCGPAGVNGSIKGIGFVHKPEYLSSTLSILREELKRPFDPRRALSILRNVVYVEEKVDFRYLSSLELARRHTWANVRDRPEATLLFFTPPETSFEVRCRVSIHESGEYWEFVNAVHDLFHRPPRGRDWSRTPAYLFEIVEIYDNSPSRMGERIYP